jgi:hypothetical protein
MGKVLTSHRIHQVDYQPSLLLPQSNFAQQIVDLPGLRSNYFRVLHACSLLTFPVLCFPHHRLFKATTTLSVEHQAVRAMAAAEAYFVGRSELLSWINSTLGLRINKVEEVCRLLTPTDARIAACVEQ